MFKEIAGDTYVLADEESLNNYAHDETENLHFLPDMVIKPRTAEEISQIMMENKIGAYRPSYRTTTTGNIFGDSDMSPAERKALDDFNAIFAPATK